MRIATLKEEGTPKKSRNTPAKLTDRSNEMCAAGDAENRDRLRATFV